MKEQLIKIHVCTVCDTKITESGLCSYQCTHDTDAIHSRPPRTVKVQIYRMTLVSEELLGD